MTHLGLQNKTVEELAEYRTQTLSELKENELQYSRRYSNSPSDYGASIDDDYNGEADEHSRLFNLLARIDEEIKRRESYGPR